MLKLVFEMWPLYEQMWQVASQYCDVWFFLPQCEHGAIYLAAINVLISLLMNLPMVTSYFHFLCVYFLAFHINGKFNSFTKSECLLSKCMCSFLRPQRKRSLKASSTNSPNLYLLANSTTNSVMDSLCFWSRMWK